MFLNHPPLDPFPLRLHFPLFIFAPLPSIFPHFFPAAAANGKSPINLLSLPPTSVGGREKETKRKRKRRRKKGVRRSEMSTPTYIVSIAMGNGGKGKVLQYNGIITLSSSSPAMQKLQTYDSQLPNKNRNALQEAYVLPLSILVFRFLLLTDLFNKNSWGIPSFLYTSTSIFESPYY